MMFIWLIMFAGCVWCENVWWRPHYFQRTRVVKMRFRSCRAFLLQKSTWWSQKMIMCSKKTSIMQKYKKINVVNFNNVLWPYRSVSFRKYFFVSTISRVDCCSSVFSFHMGHDEKWLNIVIFVVLINWLIF
jgi:hypothetical protein